MTRRELGTESAFDRDFNFLTGVEREIERAGRDNERRGVPAVEGEEEGRRKRRRAGDGDGDGLGAGLAKGEAAWMRRASKAGVNVIKAPRGMSREKMNSSRWFPKYAFLVHHGEHADEWRHRQKCLNWTIEWINTNGSKTYRNTLESSTLSTSYDRICPPPKTDSSAYVQVQLLGQETASVETEENLTEQPAAAPDTQPHTPHRDVYFYLLRPRTGTKQPVVIPLTPDMTVTAALEGRTVLEFPTIYVLPYSPDMLRVEGERREEFMLEEEFLRMRPDAGVEVDGNAETEPAENAAGPQQGEVDLGQVDEKQVLDVLTQDLFRSGSTSAKAGTGTGTAAT